MTGLTAQVWTLKAMLFPLPVCTVMGGGGFLDHSCCVEMDSLTAASSLSHTAGICSLISGTDVSVIVIGFPTVLECAHVYVSLHVRPLVFSLSGFQGSPL